MKIIDTVTAYVPFLNQQVSSGWGLEYLAQEGNRLLVEEGQVGVKLTFRPSTPMPITIDQKIAAMLDVSRCLSVPGEAPIPVSASFWDGVNLVVKPDDSVDSLKEKLIKDLHARSDQERAQNGAFAKTPAGRAMQEELSRYWGLCQMQREGDKKLQAAGVKTQRDPKVQRRLQAFQENIIRAKYGQAPNP